ncbi:MAG: hypothetical protein ACFFAL_10715 [Promethearchaeota archaeon]
MSDETKSWFKRLSPEDLIYYTRLIFAVIAAAIALGLNLSGPLGIFGFIIGITLVVISYFIALFLFRIAPEQVGGHLRGLMKGLGTGILLFLVIWLLVYNFIYWFTLPIP